MTSIVMRLLAVALISTGTYSSALAEDLPGAGAKVIPASQSGNPEELFQVYIAGMGLSDLGYDVQEPLIAQMQSAFVAVSNGDATYYSSFWDPMMTHFMENLNENKTVELLGAVSKDAMEGYLIDKKTAEANKLTSIDQLKDPKLAALFDTDGNGKANLYGCDLGWGCERQITHMIEAYGLSETVEQTSGSYAALMADVVGRVKAGQPVLYTAWQPYWLIATLQPGRDVSWLTVPFTALPDGNDVQTNIEGIGNSGFPVNAQRFLANKAFLDSNPAARKWFELITIPAADISAQNLLMHDGERSADQIKAHAEAWKAAHTEQWEKWIEEAKTAAK